MKNKTYLSPKNLRTIFGFSLSHIYNLLKDPVDPIPSFRFGTSYRILEVELDKWVERNRNRIKK